MRMITMEIALVAVVVTLEVIIMGGGGGNDEMRFKLN